MNGVQFSFNILPRTRRRGGGGKNMFSEKEKFSKIF